MFFSVELLFLFLCVCVLALSFVRWFSLLLLVLVHKIRMDFVGVATQHNFSVKKRYVFGDAYKRNEWKFHNKGDTKFEIIKKKCQDLLKFCIEFILAIFVAASPPYSSLSLAHAHALAHFKLILEFRWWISFIVNYTSTAEPFALVTFIIAETTKLWKYEEISKVFLLRHAIQYNTVRFDAMQWQWLRSHDFFQGTIL